jgi:hypothetical protein
MFNPRGFRRAKPPPFRAPIVPRVFPAEPGPPPGTLNGQRPYPIAPPLCARFPSRRFPSRVIAQAETPIHLRQRHIDADLRQVQDRTVACDNFG